MIFDNERKVEKNIETIVHKIEYVIAIFLVIGMIIGLIDLAHYFISIFQASGVDAYNEFQAFLGHALLLIVGAELILMILYHSTNALLELILFVIARKMLIYSHTPTDLVIGTVGLAIVFSIIKFLVEDESSDIMSKGEKNKPEETFTEDLIKDENIEE